MHDRFRVVGQEKKQMIRFSFIFLFTLLLFTSAAGQEATLPPSPPTDVMAKDTPNDAGGSITISWKKSPDDIGVVREENKVKGYEVLRSIEGEGEYEVSGQDHGWGTNLF